jgi:hypothetical protein
MKAKVQVRPRLYFMASTNINFFHTHFQFSMPLLVQTWAVACSVLYMDTNILV